MNTKQWAVLFVAMLSCDYAAATFYYGNYKPPKSYGTEDEGYYGWSKSCRCNDDVTNSLDGALKKVKGHLGKYKGECKLRDQSVEEYELRRGRLGGLHKFQRTGPYRCSLSRDYVRIIFSIRFIELVVYYTVSLVEDILTHYLGGIVSLIGHILGKLTNFLLQILIPDLYCTVVLHQRFGGKQGFQLEGLYMNNIDKISFKNKKFQQREHSLGPYFRPLCDHVVRSVFKDEVGSVFTEHFRNVRVKREHFYYNSNSGRKYSSSDEDGTEYFKTSSYGVNDNDDNGSDYSKTSDRSNYGGDGYDENRRDYSETSGEYGVDNTDYSETSGRYRYGGGREYYETSGTHNEGYGNEEDDDDEGYDD